MHCLLMFVGAREKNSSKLLEDLHTVRRRCLEICWHIRDHLLTKANSAIPSESVRYLHALTDCMELYVKELAILQTLNDSQHLHPAITKKAKEKHRKGSSAKVQPTTPSKPLNQELMQTMIESEREEVQVLLQDLLNRMHTDVTPDPESEQNGDGKAQRNTSSKKGFLTRRSTNHVLCCVCGDQFL